MVLVLRRNGIGLTGSYLVVRLEKKEEKERRLKGMKVVKWFGPSETGFCPCAVFFFWRLDFPDALRR